MNNVEQVHKNRDLATALISLLDGYNLLFIDQSEQVRKVLNEVRAKQAVIEMKDLNEAFRTRTKLIADLHSFNALIGFILEIKYFVEYGEFPATYLDNFEKILKLKLDLQKKQREEEA